MPSSPVLNYFKLSGTYNGKGSGSYVVRVATLDREYMERSHGASDELPIHVWRNTMSDHGQSQSHNIENFRVKRAGWRQLSRFSNDLSQWLDGEETPLEAKASALRLIKRIYRSSKSFRLVGRVTITINIRAMTESMEMTIGDSRVGREGECAVCLEELEFGATRSCGLPCCHVFHDDCIVGWIKKQPNCPLCRYKLKKPQIKDIRLRFAAI